MPSTPFVLRVLPVNGHCKVSIGVFFINSNSVLSSLHLDFPINGRGKGIRPAHLCVCLGLPELHCHWALHHHTMPFVFITVIQHMNLCWIHYMKSHVTNLWLQWLHRLHYHTPKPKSEHLLSSHQGAREQAITKCNYLYWQSNRKWGLSSLWKYFF